MATMKHLKSFLHVNYICIVVFSPDWLRIFIHSETIFIRYSLIIKSLSFAIHIQESYSSFKVFLWWQDVIISFMSAVARKIIQSCYLDRYLRSELVPILTNAKRYCMNLVTITAYLTSILSSPSAQLSGHAYARPRPNVFPKTEVPRG